MCIRDRDNSHVLIMEVSIVRGVHQDTGVFTAKQIVNAVIYQNVALNHLLTGGDDDIAP